MAERKVSHPLRAPGTVGDLIDRYLRDELPRRLRVGKMKPITATEYERIDTTLCQAFGKFKLARTAAESARHNVLRTLDVDQYLRKREGARGAVQANREVAVLSAMFAFGRRCGIENLATGIVVAHGRSHLYL